MIIVAIAMLMMSVLVPAYAQSQNGIMQQDRDQTCDPEGPATRAYGEEPPIQAREEKPEEQPEEETLEVVEDPVQEQTQEQTQNREQSKDSECENEDCEQYQYQYQYQYQHGQEE